MGNLVEIARYYDPEEAYCAKSFLLSNGIDSFLQNDHHLTMAPWLRFALNGYGLQVMASFGSEARTLLENVSRIHLESVEGNAVETIPQNRKPNWFWFPVAFANGIPFLPKRKSGWFQPFQSAILLTLYIHFLYLLQSWLWWFRYWL